MSGLSNKNLRTIILKFAAHLVLTAVAVLLAYWLRLNMPFGKVIMPPLLISTLLQLALIIYPVTLLLLSFYDPQRTYRAVDEYQILTVASLVAAILLGFAILFTARETSRILLIYFYITHFVLMLGFHTGLRLARRMRYQEGSPEPPSLTGYQRAIKRTIDVAAAGLGLVAIAPVMIAIAIAIKLDSRGPVFFRQQRVGENKRMFGMYKFRSMYTDAEQRLSEVIRHTTDGQLIHKRKDDPRVTQIGRFIRRTSLDELPQLLNVILGDMSLVGPRPELPMLVERYEPWQHERLSVPQGMTGWWQVNGRSDKPMHLHTEEDIYYVRNYSLLLDLQIMLKTVWVVFRGKGAY
jgi:lipopolysaccharide/colanic/teichoic acid biosynthesis glycosyltransferase